MDTTIKKSELSTASRVRRIIVGSAFVGIIMNITGPLGYLTLLPLLAVYPLLTGLIGEDPLDGLLANWQGGFEGKCFTASSRVALLVLGGVAIAAMMMSPETVGIRALLAIMALYPIMAGLFGEDLVSIAVGVEGKGQTSASQHMVTVFRIPKAVVAKRRTSTVRHHWFSHGAGPKAA